MRHPETTGRGHDPYTARDSMTKMRHTFPVRLSESRREMGAFATWFCGATRNKMFSDTSEESKVGIRARIVVIPNGMKKISWFFVFFFFHSLWKPHRSFRLASYGARGTVSRESATGNARVAGRKNAVRDRRCRAAVLRARVLFREGARDREREGARKS